MAEDAYARIEGSLSNRGNGHGPSFVMFFWWHHSITLNELLKAGKWVVDGNAARMSRIVCLSTSPTT